MPFDFESLFFTPRFPVTPKRRQRDIALLPEPIVTEETPFEAEINLNRPGVIGPEDYRRSAQSVIKPKPPIHPSIGESIGQGVEKLTTPLYPEAEEAIINKAKQYGGLAGGLAEYQIGGSTSPLGLMGDYLPIVGPGIAKAVGTGLAGVPFFKLGKKLRLPEINAKPILYRGDPGGHEFINPQYYNRRDTLGYMTHAAEDVDYATTDYAYKHGSPVPTYNDDVYVRKSARPNVTPITSTAQNAVDLTKLPEDPEDVEKLIKGLELWDPRRSARGKDERLTLARANELRKEIPDLYKSQQEIERKIREGLPEHYTDRWKQESIRSKMKDIRIPFNDPDITNKLGIDAIRYDDIGRMAWAFPDISKVETPWGTKLGFKSMSDYPFKLSKGYGATLDEGTIGYFKNKKDAIKYAEKNELNKPRLYLGDNPVAIPMRKNYGLADYMSDDLDIQKKIAKENKEAETKLPEEWEKFLEDEWVEDDVPVSQVKKVISPEIIDKIKHQIAKEDYAQLYDDLDKEGKQNVDDIFDELVDANVTGQSLAYKNYPSLQKELDEVYSFKPSGKPIYKAQEELDKAWNDFVEKGKTIENALPTTSVNFKKAYIKNLDKNFKTSLSASSFDKLSHTDQMNIIDKIISQNKISETMKGVDKFYQAVKDITGKNVYNLKASEIVDLLGYDPFTDWSAVKK